MYIPNWKSSADFSGAWDPVTSPLDWCESNYVWSYYVAEWWNTISNLAMILPTLLGMIQIYRSGAEMRFFMCFFSVFAVGVGSWLFHMTLTYPMQLVDELSMLYGTSVLLYSAFQIKSEHHTAHWPLVIMLACFASLVSAIYVFIGHPVFHQLAYAALVVILVLKSFSTFYEYPHYGRFFAIALGVYLLGFALWQVDVHFCSMLREARSGPFHLVPGVLELHAWWHILAGLGTYAHIVIMVATRSLVIGHGMEVRFLLGFFPVLSVKSHTT